MICKNYEQCPAYYEESIICSEKSYLCKLVKDFQQMPQKKQTRHICEFAPRCILYTQDSFCDTEENVECGLAHRRQEVTIS